MFSSLHYGFKGFLKKFLCHHFNHFNVFPEKKSSKTHAVHLLRLTNPHPYFWSRPLGQDHAAVRASLPAGSPKPRSQRASLSGLREWWQPSAPGPGPEATAAISCSLLNFLVLSLSFSFWNSLRFTRRCKNCTEFSCTFLPEITCKTSAHYSTRKLPLAQHCSPNCGPCVGLPVFVSLFFLKRYIVYTKISLLLPLQSPNPPTNPNPWQPLISVTDTVIVKILHK